MNDEDLNFTCLRCGEDLGADRVLRDASYCSACEAELDAQIEADDAFVRDEIAEMPDESPIEPEGVLDGETTDSPPASGGIYVPPTTTPAGRQAVYSQEDHDWTMRHPYFGVSPRDRDR